MNRKFTVPRLIDHGGDLSKVWYIEYQVFNPKTGRMQRFRRSKGLNDAPTIDQRLAIGRKMVTYWDARLRDPEYHPFIDNVVILDDALAYERKEQVIKAANYDIRQFITGYFRKRESQLRKKSVQTYKSHTRQFCTWLEETKKFRNHPRYFTFEQAQKFSDYVLAKKKVTNRTHNSYIRTLITIWSWFERQGLVDSNPWRRVEMLRFNSSSKRPFTPQQSAAIIAYLEAHDPWLLFFCRFQYYMLTRPCSEQTQLLVDDIDWTTQTLMVRAEIAKNRKTQPVAIPGAFLPELHKWNLDKLPKHFYIFGKFGPSEKPASRDYFSKQFRNVLDKLGIGSQWSMYSWKHTMNQRAAMKGIPLKEMQMQNRHHSLDQMNEYLKGLTVQDGYNLFNNLPTI